MKGLSRSRSKVRRRYLRRQFPFSLRGRANGERQHMRQQDRGALEECLRAYEFGCCDASSWLPDLPRPLPEPFRTEVALADAELFHVSRQALARRKSGGAAGEPGRCLDAI